MDISAQIETIRTINFTRKLENELNYWKEGANNIFGNNSDFNANDRIELLGTVLNLPTKQHETIQQQKDNIFKEIDKYTYRKQWNKLLPFHKIVKLKEYINEHIKDEKMQKEIIDKLSKYAEEGRINTKKYIIYDPNLEKILSMPCLVMYDDKNDKNDKNMYSLKVV